MEGYVFLWRKSLESEVFFSPELWQLWSWCLMRANHKQAFVNVNIGRGNITVKLLPGQFIFGRNSCATFFNLPPSTISKRMKKLEKIGNISIKSDTHYSIVSICNWDVYQDGKKQKEQASNKQVTGKEQASNTDKNEKNEKKEPKKIYGIGENVKLTNTQHEKLGEKLNGNRERYIDRLSTYDKIAKYKDHYLTILGWYKRDQEKSGSNDIDIPRGKKL
jgi:hypothetical protein